VFLHELLGQTLSKTVLRAPFDGTIAEKNVEPHVEVRTGQKLFEINASGALEVAMEIPETVISQVVIGTPVSINLSTEKNRVIKGRVTEIGSVASEGNAFPVNAALIDPTNTVQPGMTAEVTFIFKEENSDSGYGDGGSRVNSENETIRSSYFPMRVRARLASTNSRQVAF